MPRYKRSESDVFEALLEQFKAIRASSYGYDNGNIWEAKRLATALYTTVHDGGTRTISIITQLGLRGSLRFLTCALPPDQPGVQTFSIANGMLAITETAEGPIYTPALERTFSRRSILLRDWWEETLYTNTRNQSISRKNLVFSLRSQDNGSHFDESLPDSAYLGLKTANETPVIAFPGGKNSYHMSEAIPIRFGHLAMMRQVAYETTETLSEIIQGRFGNI